MSNSTGRLVTRVFWVAAAVVTLMGLTPLAAMATPPSNGTVVEGGSVPGVALGANRIQVQAAWGTPTFCQSGSRSGDRALCAWRACLACRDQRNRLDLVATRSQPRGHGA